MQGSDDLKNIALLRFYYREDPNTWSDEVFATRLAELEYVLKKTGVITDVK